MEMELEEKSKGNILIVDDDPDALDALASLLETKGYSIEACSSGTDAIEAVKRNGCETVLSDIRMPGISGLELLDAIHHHDSELPVVLITAYADLSTTVAAIKKKAFDFILKPYKGDEVSDSIEKAVRYYRLVQTEKNYKKDLELKVNEKTRQFEETLATLKSASREMIRNLATVAEYRDEDTGDHIKRIGLYSKTLSETLGMDRDFINTISFASTLHDMGKVGIPDKILLKPGDLIAAEFEVIRTHTTIGARMLSRSTFPGMDMAASIALNHHERWNGTGYPGELKGEEIPISGRIVALADQYDALRSKRPYKPPFTHEKAFTILVEGEGRTRPEFFDPEVLGAFKKVSSTFEQIFEENQNPIL